MGGHGSSCGACKFLRRKCSNVCVFAPYFCYDQAAVHFAAIHKVFGASNVSKLLSNVPTHNRSEAAATISYEALARMRDPTYGCVGQIFALQQQVAILQEEIELLETQGINHAANYVINPQSSQAMNDYSIGFPQLNDLNLQNNRNHQQAVCDTSNVTMNLNCNNIALEQQIWGNHSFSVDYANETNSLERQMVRRVGYADSMQSSSSSQVINPSLLDELLGIIDQ